LLELPFAIFGGVGSSEMVVMGILALMLFGSRLPEVARKLGGTYRGLKKSVDEFKREFEAVETYEPPKVRETEPEDRDDESKSSAPKFTPPS
jgi:sec-independent protein translocase protein TatA